MSAYAAAQGRLAQQCQDMANVLYDQLEECRYPMGANGCENCMNTGVVISCAEEHRIWVAANALVACAGDALALAAEPADGGP